MNRFQESAPAINDQTQLSLTQEAANRLLQLAPHVVQSARHYLRAQNLGSVTLPQLRALAYVLRQPESTLGELAEHLAITVPSASALVDRLVKQGLLEAKIPPENRRRVSLEITADGKAIITQVTDLWREELARRLTPLTEAELRIAIEALEILARCLP
ncbi:MAG: MarR family winged helix-turn-helix transcriptional regulator [Candidatus Competibacter sp.]